MFKRAVVLNCVMLLILAACSSAGIAPVAPAAPTDMPTRVAPATVVPPTAAPSAAEPTMAAPEPVAPALNNQLPDSCVVASQQTYVNAFDGYCFAYPSRFEMQASPTGQPGLYGPALDQSLDPIRATMGLEVEVAVKDAQLSGIVDRYLKQFEGMNVPAIARSPIMVGGEPAEMLEVIPGREGSRDVLLLHAGTLYHFMFMPSVRDFAQAKNDVEELYSAVTQSFSFTTKKPRPLPTPGQELTLKWPPFGEPVDDSPILQWESFPGAARYQIWVLDSGSAQVAVDQVITNTIMPVTPPLRKGASYNWTVQARDAKDVVLAELNSFFIVKADLELLWPRSGESVDASPVLRWKSFPGATRYQVIVVDDDAYPPKVVLDQVTTETSFTVTPPLKPGSYSWTVWAQDANAVTRAELVSQFMVTK